MMIDLKSMGLDPKSRKARLRRIALVVVALWRSEAQAHGLKSTLALYKRGVQIRTLTDSYVIVTLKGLVPNMIERGTPPHDMRNYLLKTRRAGASPIRRNKQGKPYRYIMFGRSVADIRAYGYRGAYGEAKTLEPTLQSASGKLIYGSRFSSPSQHFYSKLGVKSVSGALDGMVRMIATYSQKSDGTPVIQGAYKTWRTVSYKRPEAWQHSGLEPANIADKVRSQIPSVIESTGL
jgi:hypothetical protein